MRTQGIIKIAILLAADFAIIYGLFNIWAAGGVLGAMLLYAWLGEFIALRKDRAVGIEYVDERSRAKLNKAMDLLKEEVKARFSEDVPEMKLHVLPTDEINACSYGAGNIAVTRGTLKVADILTLKAILAHELSHSLCLDAVFHRIVFVNVTAILLGITVTSLFATSFIWLVFLILCLMGMCGSFLSVYCTSGIAKFTRGFFRGLQKLVLVIYQTLMGMVSRASEYRADRYSCRLGYGVQLKYFLRTYVLPQDGQKRTLTEIIYASHPDTCKRLEKIERNERQEISAA